MRNIKDIKKIVESSMDISLEAKKFVEIEILFRLCERIGITNEVSGLYTLLSRGDIIYDEFFSCDNYLIANAKVLLKTMSHAKVYHDTLKEYCLQNNSKYCFYIVEDNHLKHNTEMPKIYENRIEDYDKLLDIGEIVTKKAKEQTNSRDVYYARIVSDQDTHIKFETIKAKDKHKVFRERRGGHICVSMNDIMNAADKIDQMEGKYYRRKTLESNIYNISEGKKCKVNQFKIAGVTNMAGQVAAGKSTFADSLSVELVEQSYRIVMILPTVDLVMKKAEMFDKMGYSVCTLIGNYGRVKHIDNQMRGNDFLSEYVSKTLQQPCMLNALIGDCSVAVKYGQEPCVTLKSIKDQNQRITYFCQYYNFCPRTENDRNIKNADIVITTLDGFCHCSFGAEKTNFLEYAITNFDLVIMDEVDSVVCALDSSFAPVLAVNEYLKKNIGYRFDFKGSNLLEKLNRDKEEQEFIYKLDQFEHLMITISDDIKEYRTGWGEYDLKNFSAMSLLNKLRPESKNRVIIPKEIWNAFYNLLKPQSLKLGNVAEMELLNYIQAGDASIAYIVEKMSSIISLDKDVDKKNISEKFGELDNSLLKKLMFIVKVIAFEQLYRELSGLVEGMNDIPIELREILNRNLRTQQKIMPNAPVGNTLAIEVRDNEMYIKKQFALGRALALRFPYLKLDNEGNAIGANVLLMSGTGYMPGSERYHIGDKVDYVIEAEQEKRDYIAKTKIKNLRSTICVSGANASLKENNLKALIEENEKKIFSCVKHEEKILMIVNSYAQCKIAFKAVEKFLKKKESDYEVCYLKSDNGDFEINDAGNGIQRRDITNFDKGILIAPACVIERGYNIVDPIGNAWFDTVMFLVRPMVDPNDYSVHVQRVNGYIMNHYIDLKYTDRIAVMDQMRKDAFNRYSKLGTVKGGLSDLPDDMKIDAIASLFVVVEQVFGRLCRLGSKMKEKYPTIYWVDGAFNATAEGKYDTLMELDKYLKYLINDSRNPIVAKTLYEPFYLALRGEK